MASDDNDSLPEQNRPPRLSCERLDRNAKVIMWLNEMRAESDLASDHGGRGFDEESRQPLTELEERIRQRMELERQTEQWQALKLEKEL